MLSLLAAIAVHWASDDGWPSASCYPANSSFNVPACNCFGKSPHSEFNARPIIKVVVGSWFGAQVTAFLLKIVIEEELGYPTLLLSDGLVVVPGTSTLLAGPADVWARLASGEVHINPEVLTPGGAPGFAVCGTRFYSVCVGVVDRRRSR